MLRKKKKNLYRFDHVCSSFFPSHDFPPPGSDLLKRRIRRGGEILIGRSMKARVARPHPHPYPPSGPCDREKRRKTKSLQLETEWGKTTAISLADLFLSIILSIITSRKGKEGKGKRKIPTNEKDSASGRQPT